MLHTTLVVILLPSVFSAHRRLPRRVQPDISSTNSNHIQDVPDTPTAISTFSMQSGDSLTPQESSNFVTKHEYQPQRASAPAHHLPEASPSAFVAKHEYHHSTVHGPPPVKHQPAVNIRRQFTEKETQFQKKKFNPEYNYILTAGGKENVYAEDMVGGYKPQQQFDGSHPGDAASTAYANKKHEKAFKKYRYAYTNHRGESGIHQPEQTEIRSDAGHPEEAKTRFGFSEKQNYPQYVNPGRFVDKTDLHGAKSTSWKQLGPNVEISSSAEHPAFAQKLDRAQEQKLNKKRKNVPKNVRTGYMSPQHALYVANTLQSVRPPKGGLFDHNNVLKQSDRFEITDAMFQELEQEARKVGDPQVRIKQESPKDQLYKYQPEFNNFHYYQQQVTPLLNVAPLDSNAYPGKFYQPYPLSALSKGFVRNIEIETNSAGGKKSIPALIIPLTQEQLNGPLFNSDIGLYVNNPEVLNPGSKVKNVHQFPYDIVNSRFTQNDVLNTVVPIENYQFQHAAPYGFRTVEEAYNPYVHYQNHNMFRLPYLNNGAVPSTPASVDTKTPAAYSTHTVAHQNAVDTRSVPPYSVSTPKKAQKSRHQKYQGQQQLAQLGHQSQPQGPQQLSQPNQLGYQSQPQGQQQVSQLNQLGHLSQSQQLGHLSQPQQSEHGKSDYGDYVYEQEVDNKYLAPSESSHFTTVSSLKEKDQKSLEKSEARRNWECCLERRLSDEFL